MTLSIIQNGLNLSDAYFQYDINKSFNTEYKNDSRARILVISFLAEAPNANSQAEINFTRKITSPVSALDETQICGINVPGGAGEKIVFMTTAIIAPNYYYKVWTVTSNGGLITLHRWDEIDIA